MKTVAGVLAGKVQAYRNCCNTNNGEWAGNHKEDIDRIMDTYCPHGSGIDGVNQLDLDKSNGEKLVIHTSFHHMNEVGYYDGWTEHTVTITPNFDGINVSVSGRNRNDIKEYLSETFEYAFSQEYKIA
jgi:hypothetical protein